MIKTMVFFDTETTGLPNFKLPSEDESQPHIVQLAAAMVDMDSREIIQSIDVIVKPDGFMIPKEVSDIHGITHEKAMDLGVMEELALEMFLQLVYPGRGSFRTRIAHNVSFDDRIVRIAMKRHGFDDIADDYKAAEAYCTMKTATPIVKCPPTEKMIKAGFNKFKSPNLSECVRHFFGRELEGAHNAMVDVRACIDVYFAIQDLKKAA